MINKCVLSGLILAGMFALEANAATVNKSFDEFIIPEAVIDWSINYEENNLISDRTRVRGGVEYRTLTYSLDNSTKVNFKGFEDGTVFFTDNEGKEQNILIKGIVGDVEIDTLNFQSGSYLKVLKNQNETIYESIYLSFVDSLNYIYDFNFVEDNGYNSNGDYIKRTYINKWKQSNNFYSSTSLGGSLYPNVVEYRFDSLLRYEDQVNDYFAEGIGISSSPAIYSYSNSNGYSNSSTNNYRFVPLNKPVTEEEVEVPEPEVPPEVVQPVTTPEPGLLIGLSTITGLVILNKKAKK